MQKQIKIIITKFRQLLSRLFHKYYKQLPYFITSFIALFFVIGGIALFLNLTDRVNTDVLTKYDTEITQYVTSFRTPPLTQYLIFVTEVGDVYGYIIVFISFSLAFYLIFKSWNYVAQLSLVLLLAFSSNVLLKQIFNRSRPEIEHMVTVETLSYPSGHAMTAMAFYGFLIFLFYRFKINLALKFGVILLLIILIFSIGVSRIYLGVHYPSDVAGGFIAGFIWVVFCALIFDIIRVFRKDPAT